MNKIIMFFRESITARFFIPLGIILIVFGVIIFGINKENQNYIKTNAIVSRMDLVSESYIDENHNEVEATYNVYVKYNVDGKEYEEELGELSGYKENQEITIYYNPDDPVKITQTKSLVLPIVMILFGFVSFVGGIISGLNAIKKIKKMSDQEREWNNE